VFLGEDLIHTRDYSDETARIIDEEVSRILDEQAQRARQVLSEHHEALDALATALMAEESLDGDQICRIVDDAESGVVRRLPSIGA